MKKKKVVQLQGRAQVRWRVGESLGKTKRRETRLERTTLSFGVKRRSERGGKGVWGAWDHARSRGRRLGARTGERNQEIIEKEEKKSRAILPSWMKKSTLLEDQSRRAALVQKKD